MAMNFFQAQVAARRRSRWLLAMFVLAVIAVVLAVDLGVWLVSGMRTDGDDDASAAIAAATVITLAVIGIASLVRTARLRGDGGKVAQELGAVLVASDTGDPRLRRLRNVVEEMAIASGLPVPEIYVLGEEPSINAFAAGWSPASAAITVTDGALERLNRDELQGVVAHEFSHVLNGDMRVNIRLIGVLFGILVLGVIGREILASSRRGGSRGKNVAVIYLIALVLFVIGYVGLFFGRLIKAGLSRQREYLADACAVQFTRQSAGIAGALKKIAGLAEGSTITAAGAEEASHMFFGDGIGLGRLFATHPPLLDRIRALEPAFSPVALGALAARWADDPPDGMAEDLALGLAAAGQAALPAAQMSMAAAPAAIAAQVGVVDERQRLHAAAVGVAIPAALRAAAGDGDGAVLLVFALLFDDDADIRARQQCLIGERHGSALQAAATRMHAALAGLHPMLRLPLAQLAFPVLRRRPRPDLDAVIASVDALAAVAGRRSLFEYCLGCLLHRQLRESLDPSAGWRIGRLKLPDAQAQIACLLAVLASCGHATASAAQRAYAAGLDRALPRTNIPYAPPAAGAAALEPGWDALDALDPMAKAVLIEALVATCACDGQLMVAESELLRTICGVLHCPLPPLLAGG